MKSFKILVVCVFLNVSYYTNCYQIKLFSANNIDEKIWFNLKNIFVNNFIEAYKDVDIKDISKDFKTVSDYLQNLFDIDRKEISKLNFDVISANEDQEIIGYILSKYCEENKKVYIHHLVVDTNKHNKGVGKQLIKSCESFYKEAKYISLCTRRFNLKAIGFYKHIGFYETNNMEKIATVIRPKSKNDPQVISLEKNINRL